jgi:hypothetical protein
MWGEAGFYECAHLVCALPTVTLGKIYCRPSKKPEIPVEPYIPMER